MIKINKDTDVYDIDLYSERISKMGYLCYDRNDLDMRNQYLEANLLTNKNLASITMAYRSGLRQLNLSKDGVYNYLTESEYCPDHYFYPKGSDTYSIDAKKVLSKVYANGYGQEFLDYYITYRSQKLKSGKINSILDKCTTACGVNREGKTLFKIPYNVNVQQNLRFNYKDFDVISQIPKEMTSTLQVPKGYCLAWGDFAQSDFRIAYNLFLRSPENDVIMNKYDDKYEALARIVAQTMGTRFNYEEFKRDRKIYKVWTLATMYGTRHSVVPEEAKFIESFTEFLMKCPKYAEYLNRLEARVNLGLPIIITSYFGHEESVTVKYDKASTINMALNKPIQTGTSEIIIFTVNKILDEFYARGWTEDDIGIYLVRHDEPVFWMKEEVMKDAWIFSQFNQIYVDEWTPLQLDFEYGYSYKITDKNLTNIAKQSAQDNYDKIDLIIPNTCSGENDYYPVNDILELQIGWLPVYDNTIVAFYDNKRKQVSFMQLDTTDDEQIKLAVRSKLRSVSTKLLENDIHGILVYSNKLDGEDRFGAEYVRYKFESNAKINPVYILCRYMICRYCKKYNIASPVDPPLATDAEWIYSIKDMELFK